MSDTIWRIDKARHSRTAATGEGGRVAGGRWTSPGRAAIYCAQHLSLAILEVLVHAPHPAQRAAARVRFRIHLQPTLVERIELAALPGDFSPRTQYEATREIGDEWLAHGRTPALSVPSAIVPTERNYILNPAHPEFRRISWGAPESITLDGRLWTIPA